MFMKSKWMLGSFTDDPFEKIISSIETMYKNTLLLKKA